MLIGHVIEAHVIYRINGKLRNPYKIEYWTTDYVAGRLDPDQTPFMWHLSWVYTADTYLSEYLNIICHFSISDNWYCSCVLHVC